jgi:hypothetical protein
MSDTCYRMFDEASSLATCGVALSRLNTLDAWAQAAGHSAVRRTPTTKKRAEARSVIAF